MSHPSSITTETGFTIPRDGFLGAKVLVVGDLMLDRYLEGDVNRISPEAPVPVLSVRKQRSVAGGAANVALNVAGLKASVIVAGVIGNDISGDNLLDILRQSGVDVRGVIKDASRPTTCKTRIVSGNYQIVRLDEEILDPLHNDLELDLIAKVISLLDDGVNALILSDYAKGVLAKSCPHRIIEECRRRNIPVLVDPKRKDYAAYAGATVITPNQKEFETAIVGLRMSGDDFHSAGAVLRDYIQCDALLVTQGADGMTLFTEGQAHHLAALAEEVFDVSGAGDTVIATLSAALGVGWAVLPAVEIANAAASIVVKRVGTTPISWGSLVELLDEDRSVDPAD